MGMCKSCILLALFIKLISISTTIADSQDLVHTSCTQATYPNICLKTLASYSGPADTPGDLAKAAVKISISRAKKVSEFLGDFKSHSKREESALKDCVEQISDSVDNLRKTLSELQHLRSESFEWQMSNAETWVSAALTNEDTCLDGFKEMDVPNSLLSQASSVVMFNGLNFSEWKEQVQFHLGVMDLDIALDEEKPADITDTSTDEEKLYHKSWLKANKLCLMFMRMTIAANIKDTLPQTDNAKEYMTFVEDRFRSADKSLSATLMASLTAMKFDGSRSMHDHLIEMTNIATKLRRLGMTIDDDFLIHFVLHSLPPEFGTFQVNYNTIKDKWSLNELSSKLIQEELRLKNQGGHSLNLVKHEAGPSKKNRFKHKGTKNNEFNNDAKTQEKERKNDRCRFCKKKGHYQKDCNKRKDWFEKKGIPYDPNHKPK